MSDWILIRGRRHLHRVLAEYPRHYNAARPHRGLDLAIPQPTPAAAPPTRPGSARQIHRVDVLGGLVHEYVIAA